MTIDSEPEAVIPSTPDLKRRDQFAGVVTSKRILFLIIVLAVTLRLGSALFQGNTVLEMPGIADQLSYHGLAQRVVDGYGFSFAEGHWPATPGGEPTAHWSYAYTLFLAGIYAMVGVQPVFARIVQAVVVGVLHTWLAWRIGNRIFGPLTGIIAATLTAVYIYYVYYTAGLLTESFYIICILWVFDAAFRIVESASTTNGAGRQGAISIWLWLELGLAVALTVLLRQVYLLFLPFLFLWLLWSFQSQSGWKIRPENSWLWLKGLTVVSLIVVIFVLPWTIRNYRAFDTIVPLNTNAGFAFFWGNHPIHGTEFIPILPHDGPSYQDLIPAELLTLNEGQMDRALLREGLQFVVEDPVRYALLSTSRVREYFRFWPSPESSPISNIARVGSFGLMLPFMLYGLWCSFATVRKPTSPQQRYEIVLLYSFMVVYTLLHLLTWTLIRYRLPVDAILLIFAAYGISDLIRRVSRGRFGHAS